MATGNVTGNYHALICLVINCTDTTYLLKTVNVLRKSEQEITSSSKTLAGINVRAIQNSEETKHPGAVTYVQNGLSVMRADLNAQEEIEVTMIASIPSATTAIIVDAVVTDTFILVRWSNLRFTVYIRPT